MYYFAYGSNVNRGRMADRCPSSIFISRDHIKGYKLVFNKLGLDGSGKANIIPMKNSTVYGALYEVTEEDIKLLDGFEGEGYHYHRRTIVTDFNNVKSYIYIANNDFIDDEIKPISIYKQLVLTGLKQVKAPKTYIQKVKDVEICSLMDARRKVAELKKLYIQQCIDSKKQTKIVKCKVRKSKK